MVRIHWENMPPYQIVLALLQDSVLPLGRFVCWSLLAAGWTFLRNLAHLLKFAKSSLNHDFHTLRKCAHKNDNNDIAWKNEANFFKTRRWFSKNFFSHVQSSVIELRFYPIFYLPLMSWNEGIFWACHQIFSSQKRLKPLSLALFSFVVHSEFFFHVDLSQKSLLFDWSRNEHDIHRGSCHKRRPPFFVAPHQNASFKKNQFFVKSPCMLYSMSR